MTPSHERKAMPWGDVPRGDQPFDGLLIIDKPRGVTSHDVVGAVRRLAGTRKVGHAGTLDPMATGVLCVGVGRATKLLQYVSGADKTYVATIRLGEETSTEDAEGETLCTRGIDALGERDSWQSVVQEAMEVFTGEILQVPSSVSAIKIDGRPAYARIRSGETVEIPARPVTVSEFVLTELRLGGSGNVLDCDVVVTCSSGTYVRALARDVGNHLRTGAHVTALRRLRVGSWSIDRACQIEECAARVAEGGALTHVGVDELCRKLFPVFEISAEEADLLRHGQFIAGRSGNPEGIGAAFCADRCVALVTPRGQKLKPHLIVSVK